MADINALLKTVLSAFGKTEERKALERDGLHEINRGNEMLKDAPIAPGHKDASLLKRLSELHKDLFLKWQDLQAHPPLKQAGIELSLLKAQEKGRAALNIATPYGEFNLFFEPGGTLGHYVNEWNKVNAVLNGDPQTAVEKGVAKAARHGLKKWDIHLNKEDAESLTHIIASRQPETLIQFLQEKAEHKAEHELQRVLPGDFPRLKTPPSQNR